MSSGIYKITNLVNGKCYIGSSVDVDKRLKQHIQELRRNEHHSITLQRSWNKYGENSFKFEILDNIKNKELLMEVEQYYLDIYESYKSEIGFNISPSAFNTLGVKKTEETKKKLSEAAKRQKNNKFRLKGKDSINWRRKHSDEWKELMSNKNSGKNNPFFGRKHSEETKLKIGQKNKGNISPTRKLTQDQVRDIIILYKNKIYNQFELAELFNTDQTNVSLIVNGKSWTKIYDEVIAGG